MQETIVLIYFHSSVRWPLNAEALPSAKEILTRFVFSKRSSKSTCKPTPVKTRK